MEERKGYNVLGMKEDGRMEGWKDGRKGFKVGIPVDKDRRKEVRV